MTRTANFACDNLDIRIESDGRGGYRSQILYSPAGEAVAALDLPGGDPAQLAADPADPQQVRRVGAQLFDALFPGDLRSRYDVSRQMAADRDRGLRVRLRIATPELAQLPWEWLYDARAAEFVALSTHTPLVRYLDVPQPGRPLRTAPPLRILVMSASPVDMPALDVARERRWLEEAVQPLQDAGRVERVWLAGQTVRALQDALQAETWHIFHFIGHGLFGVSGADGDEGALLLADDANQAQPLSATGLARLLADHDALRLAVLNACHGAQSDGRSLFASVATALVRRGLPAVLAMHDALSDAAAVECTRSFYGALTNGLPVDAAVTEARKAMSLADSQSSEWATPVLFMRAPDGVLWQVAEQTDEQIDRQLDDEEETVTDNAQQPWWEQVSGSVGGIDTDHTEGDVIIANVGAGARNVAVGKNITQQIIETLGEPTPQDRALIEQRFEQLFAMLDGAQIAPRTAGRAEAELERLQEELSKTAEGETPDADTITRIGDWLLENVPELAAALAELFGMAAVGRGLAKAGVAAVKWARERFGNPAADE